MAVWGPPGGFEAVERRLLYRRTADYSGLRVRRFVPHKFIMVVRRTASCPLKNVRAS